MFSSRNTSQSCHASRHQSLISCKQKAFPPTTAALRGRHCWVSMGRICMSVGVIQGDLSLLPQKSWVVGVQKAVRCAAARSPAIPRASQKGFAHPSTAQWAGQKAGDKSGQFSRKDVVEQWVTCPSTKNSFSQQFVCCLHHRETRKTPQLQGNKKKSKWGNPCSSCSTEPVV